MPRRKGPSVGAMFAESDSDQSSKDSDSEPECTDMVAELLTSGSRAPAQASTSSAASSAADQHSATTNVRQVVTKSKNKALEQTLSKSIVLQPGFEQLHELPSAQGRRQLRKQRKLEREKTKGTDWFNMPATELTEERKRDLQILQMRDALDPKRFYRQNDRDVIPKYFQVGTVIEHASDFYHSRVPKKQRKRTIVEEILADSEAQTYQKRRYEEIEAHRRLTQKGAFTKQGVRKREKTRKMK